MKIVVNTCYGGFGLSDEAQAEYLLRSLCPCGSGHGVLDTENFWDGQIPRDDAVLVAMVEADADGVSGDHAELAIIEIPDGVDWVIEDYDGIEWVAEVHRTWH